MAISGRSQKTLDEAAKALGKDALVVQADVSKLEDADKLFSAIDKQLGKIDILFVNAGVAKFVPVDQVSEEHYDETFDINTKGAYFTIRKALPDLNDTGASIILNTSVVSHKGIAAASVYSGTPRRRCGRSPEPGGGAGSAQYSGECGCAWTNRNADFRAKWRHQRRFG